MRRLFLILLIFLASIEAGNCQDFFKKLKKEQITSLKSANAFDSYNLSKWYKKIVTNRKKYLKKTFNEKFINSDSLFICEYISLPDAGMHGVIYDNKLSFYEYHITDNYKDFILSSTTKNSLIEKYKYSFYLNDSEFKLLKNDLLFSSPICDGNIIVLIKCIKNGASYKFQSIIFESFNKHQILIE